VLRQGRDRDRRNGDGRERRNITGLPALSLNQAGTEENQRDRHRGAESDLQRRDAAEPPQ
jgi:hypothetical protein